jgi:hypothetical protein
LALVAGFWLAVASGAEANLTWQLGDGFRYAPLNVPARGSAGFERVSNREAGIAFRNQVPFEKIKENHNLMNGSGVAAGDFDGDGWCDLYFCAMDGTNALYRNLGGWRFENVTGRAGVGCPGMRSSGAVFADVNADGKLDLLVSTLGTGVHLFLNEGGGRFRETTIEAGLGGQTGSTSVALADVNGDGYLDLYVANYGAMSVYRAGGSARMVQVNGKWVFQSPNASRLRFVNGRIEEVGEPDALYLNDGKGRFSPLPWDSGNFLDEDGKPMPPPPDFGLSVQLRDLNGDGAPDIYVCNDFDSPDRLWLNDGKGRFRAPPRQAMRKQSASSMGVDFADLAREGKLDFFTTEMVGRGHQRQMQDMASTQARMPEPGRIDDRPDAGRNALFQNRGDGTYAEVANEAGVAASDWSWQPTFLDVDLDGYEDLLIGNGMWFDLQNRDTVARIRSLGKQTVEQSRTNLALYPLYASPNAAFRNRRDFTFEDVSRAWGFDAVEVSQGTALADLDHDGGLDVIINCFNSGPLLLRNRGNAARIAVRLRGKQPNVQGIGAMIRVMGGPARIQMQEILAGGRYLSGDDPMRVFAAGSPTNDLRIEVRWRSGVMSTIAGARPNCVYEIHETGASTPVSSPAAKAAEPLFRDASSLLEHRHFETWFGDYARQPLLMRQFSQLGPGAAWVDLDEDGHDELAIGSGKGGSFEIFRRNNTGRFEKVVRSPPVGDDLCGMAAWTTVDGRRGVLVAQANYEVEPASTNAVLAFIAGTDQNPVSWGPLAGVDVAAGSPGPLAVGDMDGDGNLELFVGGRLLRGAYPRSTGSRLFRQENGRLAPDLANSPLLEQAGLVSGAVWSDLDGDGYPELILACEWGPIRIYRNNRGRLMEWDAPLVTAAASSLGGASLGQLTGWWSGITTGDFDGDGRLDMIVGNWGLNDAYVASPEHPLRLYYGDLAGNGTTDLIEAYYAPEMGVEVPRRTLTALGNAFPSLMARFPTHEAYGRASASAILSLLPNRPRTVEAVTLRTMLFLNRGDQLAPVLLPREAQLAPVFSLNVADMDGDGNEDVFLSQNFFAVRPEWHRLDAGRGLWLRGDGKGGLAAVPGQESGVLVYGEQRGAATADFNEDGRVDLVVTQNGAATRLFENAGGRPGLRVRLKGPPGNPLGIGAQVRLAFRDRQGPVREIHGGGGYWSQDSPVAVLGGAAPPSHVRVLWPGGKTLTGEIPSGAREVQVGFDGVISRVR